MNIGEMCVQSAARFDDNLAVAYVSTDGTRTHTFESLNTASDCVANGLLDSGIGFGDTVAILSHNSIEFVETFFATQKLGARVLPINVRFDTADIEYVLNDAKPTCLVAEAGLLAENGGADRLLGNRNASVFVVDNTTPNGDGNDPQVTDTDPEMGDGGVTLTGDDVRSFSELREGSTKPPGISVGDDTIDGYFYTSGSTGNPKGVVHRHRDRAFVDLNVIAEFGLRHDDVNVNPLPLFHSGPLYTGFVPFVQFGVPTIVLRRFDAERTLQAVEKWEATVLGGVPAQYERLVSEAASGGYDTDSLRFWWVSGAPLTESLRKRCHEVLCDRHSIVYGATEVGPPVSILPPEESDEHPDSCGTGLMGQTVRVVDPDGEHDPAETVDAGKTGELVVRGESVMDRYLGMPEETSRVLVDGWYFTGDLGWRGADGYLTIEGRKDEMIITGGENVYPTEVENVLFDHKSVADAAVLGVSDKEWGEVPKAFVVPADGADLNAEAVKRYCRESRLAEYKRPRRVTFVPEIPRNPSGGSVLRSELLSVE